MLVKLLIFITCLSFVDDNSRVCLNEIPRDTGSDYINASYISVSVYVAHSPLSVGVVKL